MSSTVIPSMLWQSSIHKPLYDAMHEKLNRDKNYTRKLIKRRSSAVEPVLGTLINYHNMKRVNSRSLKQANKHVLMAALSYNLKKYLKIITKEVKANAVAMSKRQEGVWFYLNQDQQTSITLF